MTVLVYRVENTDGVGPYWGKIRDWYNKSRCRHDIGLNRPGPGECPKIKSTFGRNVPIDYNFGFYSLASLKTWFPKSDRKLLKEDGYSISVYKVPKKSYFRATKQCIFIKEDSEFIEKIDIDKI